MDSRVWSPRDRVNTVLGVPGHRWKAEALTGIVRPFHQQLGLEFELPDLGPLGPGLVLDERYSDGRRVLVWTD